MKINMPEEWLKATDVFNKVCDILQINKKKVMK